MTQSKQEAIPHRNNDVFPFKIDLRHECNAFVLYIKKPHYINKKLYENLMKMLNVQLETWSFRLNVGQLLLRTISMRVLKMVRDFKHYELDTWLCFFSYYDIVTYNMLVN